MSQICSLHMVSGIEINKVLTIENALDFEYLFGFESFDRKGVELSSCWQDLHNFFVQKDPIKINIGKIFEIDIVTNNQTGLGFVSADLVEEDAIMLSCFPLEEIVTTLNQIEITANQIIDINKPDHIFTTEDDIEYIARNYKELYKYFHKAMEVNYGMVIRIA